MTEKLLHLVRHGEVDNPDGVLYGRLPGYGLTERGHEMAALAAKYLADRGRRVTALYASPLLRAQQSARPIAREFQVEVVSEPRLIEPTNRFEGKPNRGPASAFKQPRNWYLFWNPLLPSWGEPYARIQRRVQQAMDAAWQANRDGDTVMVSHQAAIWNAHLAAAGKLLAHNPATRRCDLSSVTSFTKRNGLWTEVAYASPAAALIDAARDIGAV